MAVKFSPDDTKLGELMLYVAERSKLDPFFGATKLNKILFHADFRAYRRWRKPITGQAYFRLPEGPAPQVLVKVRDRLMSAGDGALQSAQVFGREQKRFVAMRPPDTTIFSEDELALVDDIIDELTGQTAAQVTAGSHRLPGWRAAADREVIPYETAFLSATVTDADRAWAVAIALDHGWI